MAGELERIEAVIRRLDRLDGRVDGRYTDLPLHEQNTTGLCEIAHIARGQLGDSVTINLSFENFNCEAVDVDCRALAMQLERLAGIAERLPSIPFRMHNNTLPRGELLKRLRATSFDDQLCYHIVDHMITSLLLGVNRADMAAPELFSKVGFEQYVAGMRAMAREAKISNWLSKDVGGVKQAYEIFERAGKRYGFDAKPFKPK